jgi:PAS domain-containing protein
MTLPGGLFILLFAAISLLSAAVAVVLAGYAQVSLSRWLGKPSEDAPCDGMPDRDASLSAPLRYIFRGGRLLSGIRDDDPFLAPDIDPAYAHVALREAMVTLHPDLPDRIDALIARGEGFRMMGYLGRDALSVAGQVEQDRLTVTVAPMAEAEAECLDLAEREVSGLRQRLALCADVQWAEHPDHGVTWANAAYLRLCEEADGPGQGALHWPLPRLFGDQLDPPPTDGKQRRCHLALRQKPDLHWFEVSASRPNETETMFSARAIDKLVTAETSLRDFVQTLSKTFATLPVGLAVFDRGRELVLFNPALISVTTLEAAFLTRRPTLRAFLDQLREARRMPEPRDYRGWREEIALLEQGAEQDRYHEIWTLPSGETLRVTGRPHPNGAIAFVFEDISQEVSLTRKFRTELDLDRCILDDIPAGMIVFDLEGSVLRTNAAYRAMLDSWARSEGAPDMAVDATLKDMTPIWQRTFQPSGLWGEIRQFVRHETDREAWSDALIGKAGSMMHCRIAPLRGGHSIVWFIPGDADLGDVLRDEAWPGERIETDATSAVEPERGQGVA